jgi:hypothetical protein
LAVTAAGVVVAIIALFVGTGSSNSGHDSATTLATRPGKLAAVAVQVHDVSPFEGGRASLEVTLHNKGRRLIVVDAAEIKVDRIYKLRRCASQGDILLSHVYGLSLPAKAPDGAVFKAPLHQQVGPDEADRFSIALGTKLPEADQTSVYLFEIEVGLLNDGPQPDLSLGTAIVGLPELPSPGEYFWDSTTPEVVQNLVLTSPGYVPYLRRVAMPCWRSNTAALEGVVSGDRVQSEELQRLVKGLRQPSAGALE